MYLKWHLVQGEEIENHCSRLLRRCMRGAVGEDETNYWKLTFPNNQVENNIKNGNLLIFL